MEGIWQEASSDVDKHNIILYVRVCLREQSNHYLGTGERYYIFYLTVTVLWQWRVGGGGQDVFF